MSPTFFRNPAAFRRWLEKNHTAARELWVGLVKKHAGKVGLLYAEALDQALCFGWIDGVRRRIDDHRWTIRFTPRKSSSVWSHVNIRRVRELTALGLMRPAGLQAFRRRDEKRSRLYSYENIKRGRRLDPTYARRFRANQQAWTFFETQAPSYQRTTQWWVMSAKQEATRLRRLAVLIERSAEGARLGQFTRR